jgi:hypothetical protein
LGIIDHEHAPRQKVSEGCGHAGVKAADAPALITRVQGRFESMVGKLGQEADGLGGICRGWMADGGSGRRRQGVTKS